MTKNNKISLLLLATVVMASAWACRSERNEAPPKAEGNTGVHLAAEAVKSAGIEEAKAEEREFSPLILANGSVALNPRRTVQISTTAAGRIEAVHAFPGDRVKAGEPLVSIYSPEFQAAQAEVLQLKIGFQGDPGGVAAGLMAAAENRLRRLGMTPDEIVLLCQEKLPRPLLHLRATIGGTVCDSTAVRGAYQEAFRPLMTITDFTSPWLEADIYEKDIGLLSGPADAEARITAFPDLVIRGKVIGLGDHLDAASRTLRVRLELDDGTGRLRPGMSAQVTIRPTRRERNLAVPEGAVRRDGKESLVFVPGREGEYLPRRVTTGRSQDGWIEILSGLKPGETVIAAGSFLLKSEMLKSRYSGE